MKNIGRANSYLALVSGIQKCNDTSNWALETESLAVFIASAKTFLQAALLLLTNVHSPQCALLEERHAHSIMLPFFFLKELKYSFAIESMTISKYY